MVKVGRVAVTSADPPRWRASTSGPWVRQAERFKLRMATVRPSLVSIANIFQRVSLNSWELRRCSCALAETTKVCPVCVYRSPVRCELVRAAATGLRKTITPSKL